VYNYESHIALNGGDNDGMKIIRTIIRTLPKICNVNATCWLEVDPTQPILIKEYCLQQQQQLQALDTISEDICTNSNQDECRSTSTSTTNKEKRKDVQFVECIKDMFGLDRFVKLQIVER
jgi:methylase of polypeptide subunit release factors